MTSVVSSSLDHPSACLVVDLDGRICGWSHGAQALFGRTAADALGRNLSSLFGPHVLADLEHAALSFEQRASRAARCANGHEVQLDLHITRVATRPGEPERFVVIAADLRAQRRLEAELLRQTELEHYLLGVVGHDLRNPLHAVMLSAAHVLQRDLEPKLRKNLERIRASAERAVRMTYDLLDFDRVRRGHGLPIERRHVDLLTLLEEQVAEALHLRPERSVTVESHGDVNGQWDPDRLRQLLQNLLSNALVHTTEEVAVHVVLEDVGDAVQLTVRNAGPALSEDMQSRLFKPYMLSHGNEPGARTLGLGLYIARAIAQGHGGSLTACSDPVSGTRFIASLPRSATPPISMRGNAR